MKHKILTHFIVAFLSLIPLFAFATDEKQADKNEFKATIQTDYLAPRNAAQIALGLAPSSATVPATFSEFAAGLFRSFDGTGSFREGFNVSAPWRNFFGPGYVLPRSYAKNPLLTSNLSIVFSPGQDKAAPHQAALGWAFSIHDQTQWTSDPKNWKIFDEVLFDGTYEPMVPLIRDGENLDDLRTAIITSIENNRKLINRSRVIFMSEDLEEPPSWIQDINKIAEENNLSELKEILSKKSPEEISEHIIDSLTLFDSELETLLSTPSTLVAVQNGTFTFHPTLVKLDNYIDGTETMGNERYQGALAAFEVPQYKFTSQINKAFEKQDKELAKKYWNKPKVDASLAMTWLSTDQTWEKFQSSGLNTWITAQVPMGETAILSGQMRYVIGARNYDTDTKILSRWQNGWSGALRITNGNPDQNWSLEYLWADSAFAAEGAKTEFRLSFETKINDQSFQIYASSLKNAATESRALFGLNWTVSQSAKKEVGK